MGNPSVSVIVPVYNGEATIERCIESLVDQDYPRQRYEIIVVDNNSTDGTVEIVRRYPVLLLEERRPGPGAARNRGLAQARGEIIAFTDADCYAEARWLKELVKPFVDPMVGGVGGAIKSASRATAVERYSDDRPVLKHHLSDPPFLPFLTTANAAFRNNIIDAVGGFDESFTKASEDVDLSWRIQLEAPCKFVSASKAVVYHKHRQTVRGLFAQSFLYHSTSHELSVKFSSCGHYPTPRVRNTLYFYWTLLVYIPTWFGVRFLKWAVGRKSQDAMLYPFFEWVWRSGIAAARLKSTLVHRRYYL
jgi:glycosyltransferase involved in cell wall biosynthesis